jgi:D-serine deaminase-like pyridoxal phosphate-dependent protein
MKVLMSEIDLSVYRLHREREVLTPALIIYPEIVDQNIATTLRLLGNDPARWRPHVKTAKIGSMIRRMVAAGITNFKCATTLELNTACEAGAQDVLFAYPAIGANALRAREIASQFKNVRFSAVIEDSRGVDSWRGSNFGIFIDINPGMDRTGVEQNKSDEIVSLARAIKNAGLVFRGLHYYDGHLSKYDLEQRTAIAHAGYDILMKIAAHLEEREFIIEEVITAGTPSLPCSISYEPFQNGRFIHRVSPGTVVYNDCSSLSQLPSEFGYKPAALVLSTVVSHPRPGRLTCDAGHKTVSADHGVPTCRVIGRDDLSPSQPSEEHLPIDAAASSTLPDLGEMLYLMPRHVCPTVNNFDHALIAIDGRIVQMDEVTARGREAPLMGAEGLPASTR